MKIENDNTVNNMTLKYLFPMLYKHGEEFSKQLNKLEIQGAFCNDAEFEPDTKCLYVLSNVKHSDFETLSFVLKSIEQHESFKGVYIFDVEKKTKTPKRLVIAIKFPDEYEDAIDKMLDGIYKLYNPQDFHYFKSRKLNYKYNDILDVFLNIKKEKTPIFAEEILNF